MPESKQMQFEILEVCQNVAAKRPTFHTVHEAPQEYAAATTCVFLVLFLQLSPKCQLAAPDSEYGQWAEKHHRRPLLQPLPHREDPFGLLEDQLQQGFSGIMLAFSGFPGLH